jgi:hypothetical protein
MNTNATSNMSAMEQAIRSAITAAVHQVKSKMYEREPEDPVQAFLDDLFAVLFPASVPAPATMPPLLERTDDLTHTDCEAACCSTQEVTVPVPEVVAPAQKEKKPRKKKADSPETEPKEKKPRKKKETPAPAPVPETIEVVVHDAPAVEETPAPAAKEKKPRKKKETPAPASPTAAPAPEVPAAPKKAKKVKSPTVTEPVPAPVELAPAPAPEPKAKKVKSPKPEGVNLDKLTPTQVKKLKAVADELHVELDKKAFLAHLNTMTPAVFGATTLESHYRHFLQPEPVTEAVAEEKEMDAVEVEFEGKTYYVDETDMRVYEEQGEVFVPVGYVGMAAFKDLVVPREES